MSKKRILIMEVSGECRYLRVNVDPFDDKPGIYCAYNPHSDWERIKKGDCAKCTRDKCLNGRDRSEVIDTVAKTLYGFTYPGRSWQTARQAHKDIYRLRAGKIINKLAKGKK